MEDMERLEFWSNDDLYKKLTDNFIDEFKNNLIKSIEPIITKLVIHLRCLEREQSGRGKDELNYLLENSTINQAMFNIIEPTLNKLDSDFRINLYGSTIIEPTILS